MDTLGQVPAPRRRSRGHGHRFGRALLAAALVLAIGAAPATGAGFGSWHRNNNNAGHEALQCLEVPAFWSCTYDLTPDTADTQGRFVGRNVTATWTCPTWFPAAVCEDVTSVYRGTAVYNWDDGTSSSVPQEYVLTNQGGREVLYLHWLESVFGPFVCPWYRTFEEALVADFRCTSES